MLAEDFDPEVGLFLVGNTFLGLACRKEGLGGLITALVVAVIGAADHAIGMQFDLAPLLEGGGGDFGVEDLDPVDPEGEFWPDAVSAVCFAEDLQGAFVRIEGAAFAQEEAAAAAVDDVDGEFEELRLLHRPRHLMGAGDGSLERAEFEEVPGFRRVGRAGDPYPDRISSRGPVAGDVERLVRVGEDVGIGEERAGLGGGVVEVGFLLGSGEYPVAPTLLVGVDLVDVPELLGGGGAGDAFPLVITVGGIAFLLGVDRGDDRGVLRLGGGRVDFLGPGDITVVAVDAIGVGFGDTRRGVILGFDVRLQSLGRLSVADEVLVDRLMSEGEIALELVRRHEQG